MILVFSDQRGNERFFLRAKRAKRPFDWAVLDAANYPWFSVRIVEEK